MNTLDAETRERLIEEFRACLDENMVLPDEADDDVDLHSLLSEMAVLKNEIRLESRQFKAALDDMRAVTAELQASNGRLTMDLERSREQTATARRQAERQMLLELLEFRDRVEAGLATLQDHRPGWTARLFSGDTVRFISSLREGQGLTLQRLDHVLERYRVQPIVTLDRTLDPQCMNVVGTKTLPQTAEGVVVAEQRRGFFHDGEVLRCAEVIVNKRQA